MDQCQQAENETRLRLTEQLKDIFLQGLTPVELNELYRRCTEEVGLSEDFLNREDLTNPVMQRVMDAVWEKYGFDRMIHRAFDVQ